MKKKTIILAFVILIIIGIIAYILSNNKEILNHHIEEKKTTSIIKNNIAQNKVSFEDITNLPEEYTTEQAVEEHFVVITPKETYHKSLYDDFMLDLNAKKDCSLKIMMYTIEGDPILVKVIYVADEEKFYACEDNTRDKFSNNEDRKYHFYEFDDLRHDELSQNFYFINENDEEVYLFYIPNELNP
ncbi:MAG: DUF4362 domain-containing protein [Clostridia bacterium]|nr:DUF4362 domain-containing protein [Clostridia bacterium]